MWPFDPSLLTENQNGTIGDIQHVGRRQFPAISSILVELRLRCNALSLDGDILITVGGLNFLRKNHRSECNKSQQENDQYQTCFCKPVHVYVPPFTSIGLKS